MKKPFQTMTSKILIFLSSQFLIISFNSYATDNNINALQFQHQPNLRADQLEDSRLCDVTKYLYPLLSEQGEAIPTWITSILKAPTFSEMASAAKAIIESPIGARALKNAIAKLEIRSDMPIHDLLFDFYSVDPLFDTNKYALLSSLSITFSNELKQLLRNENYSFETLTKWNLTNEQPRKMLEMLPIGQLDGTSQIEIFIFKQLRSLVSDKNLFDKWYSEKIPAKTPVSPQYWSIETDQHYLNELTSFGASPENAKLALTALKVQESLSNGFYETLIKKTGSKRNKENKNIPINTAYFEREFSKSIKTHPTKKETQIFNRGVFDFANDIIEALPKNKFEKDILVKEYSKKMALEPRHIESIFEDLTKLTDSNGKPSSLLIEIIGKHFRTLKTDGKLHSHLLALKIAINQQIRKRFLSGHLNPDEAHSYCGFLSVISHALTIPASFIFSARIASMVNDSDPALDSQIESARWASPFLPVSLFWGDSLGFLLKDNFFSASVCTKWATRNFEP